MGESVGSERGVEVSMSILQRRVPRNLLSDGVVFRVARGGGTRVQADYV